MVHNMKLNESPFEKIKAGTKTIEMRLYDEKRRNVNVGDIIEFTSLANGEKIQVEVLALHTDMEQYYLPTEIEKYGVVGIEIRLI